MGAAALDGDSEDVQLVRAVPQQPRQRGPGAGSNHLGRLGPQKSSLVKLSGLPYWSDRKTASGFFGAFGVNFQRSRRLNLLFLGPLGWFLRSTEGEEAAEGILLAITFGEGPKRLTFD